jgi:hypothetical protein
MRDTVIVQRIDNQEKRCESMKRRKVRTSFLLMDQLMMALEETEHHGTLGGVGNV